MSGRIGFVGLGIMGGAMARNLAERGWDVIGLDLSPDRATRPHGMASRSRPMSPSSPGVLRSFSRACRAQALFGNGRRHRGGRAVEPRVVAETSTLALEDKLAFERTLSAAGHVALDCPLSGTGAQAQTRDLVSTRAATPPRSPGPCRPSPILRARRTTSGVSATAPA
jgi:3-hydroxyisobutyrate dehydrogenase-like beta-hydroxyacid dehydrogenase